MSYLTTEDVINFTGTTVAPATIQEIIDQEEAWLVRQIGPLVGERTETFYLAGPSDILRLRRPTDSVEVEDAGTSLSDVEVRSNGWRVLRTAGWWGIVGPVTVTYEPNDELEIRRVLISLVRLALLVIEDPAVGNAFESERIGEYSYKKATGALTPVSIRRALVRSLQMPTAPGSLKLLSSVAIDYHNRATITSVA
jgi:hypothetical protein